MKKFNNENIRRDIFYSLVYLIIATSLTLVAALVHII